MIATLIYMNLQTRLQVTVGVSAPRYTTCHDKNTGLLLALHQQIIYGTWIIYGIQNGKYHIA